MRNGNNRRGETACGWCFGAIRFFKGDARKEATREGTPPIDLIDGEALAEKLKELTLGVRAQMVEEVEIDAEWFAKI